MAKKEGNPTSIPAGFRRVESGSFPQNHDFKAEPVLIGKVADLKTTPQKRGKKIEDVRIAYIANEKTGEIVAVWDSAALGGLFAEMKKGSRVYIKFNGVKKLPGKKTLKQFDAYIAGK